MYNLTPQLMLHKKCTSIHVNLQTGSAFLSVNFIQFILLIEFLLLPLYVI